MTKKPFLIGVAGGISSGKSTVCETIIVELGKLGNMQAKQVLVISLDSFYRTLSADNLKRAEHGEFNLDHPDSFDDDLCLRTLTSLMQNKDGKVDIAIYDRKSYRTTGQRSISSDAMPDVIIIEGILVFYYPKIRELCQMKLFVDCDADTRLSRRVTRDMIEYNRPLDFILNYYQKYVKPTFEDFCLPTKKYADVIIPRGAENMVAINLIVHHINDLLSANNQSKSDLSISSPWIKSSANRFNWPAATDNVITSDKESEHGDLDPISELGLQIPSNNSSSKLSSNSSSPSPTKRGDRRPH